MRKVVVLAARLCPRQIGQIGQARWWARARRTAQRPRQDLGVLGTPSVGRVASAKEASSVLGLRSASSSPDAAFSRNLEAEAAMAVGKHAMSVLVDMFKCYECIIVCMLLYEARALEYHLRMIWMLLALYRCP
eukprot:2710764-Pyramimonas_sp.AAC.1